MVALEALLCGQEKYSKSACMIPRLVLRHRDFMQGISQACNNDDVILRAYSLQVEIIDTENDYSSYTSQLNITYSASLIGSSVVCAYDNGTQVMHLHWIENYSINHKVYVNCMTLYI